MEDKELLELAAKVAAQERSAAGDLWSNTRGMLWDPLQDDGDALRLAVKLGLHIQCDTNDECLRDADAAVEVTAFGDSVAHTIEQPAGRDPYAATRRAIVRAAAAMATALGA